MSDRFEDDLMEDLMAEPMDEFDEAEEADAAEESDELEEFDELDEFDNSADEMKSFEGEESGDEFEEAVTDALEAEDADEFFGGFKNVLKTVGNVARKVGPIAKMIPIPQAQLIGGAADLIGNVLADEGDEMDAMEALSDFADEEEGFDALAPAVAGLAIRGALKHKAAHMPRVHRRKLVKTVSAAARQIARKHGTGAMVASPGSSARRGNLLRSGFRSKYAESSRASRGLPALAAHASQVRQVGARLRTGAWRIGRRAPRRCRTRRGFGALVRESVAGASWVVFARRRPIGGGATGMSVRPASAALSAERPGFGDDPFIRTDRGRGASGKRPPRPASLGRFCVAQDGVAARSGQTGYLVMERRSFMEARAFLRARIVGLAARARRLARIDYDSVGIRPQDLPYAPSPEHFKAANERLAAIDTDIARRLGMLRQSAAKRRAVSGC